MTRASEEIERNEASRRQLREMVQRLSWEDLERPLGGGWTVKVARAHLAFWDGRQRESLKRHLESGAALGDGTPPALEDSEEVINDALVPLASRIDPTAVRSLVLEAAEAVDAALEDADPEAVQRLVGGPQDSLVRRWLHREEHVEQITRALSD